MDSSLKTIDAGPPAKPAPARPEAAAPGKALPKDGEKLPERDDPPPSRERVEQAIRQIQEYLVESRRQLQFELDPASSRMVVRVVNPETGEVIRQIPGDEVLKLARTAGNGGRLFTDLV